MVGIIALFCLKIQVKTSNKNTGKYTNPGHKQACPYFFPLLYTHLLVTYAALKSSPDCPG